MRLFGASAGMVAGVLLLFVPLAGSLGQTGSDKNGQLTEDEVRSYIAEIYVPWSEGDIEAIAMKQSTSFEQGFGFRTLAARLDNNVATIEQLKQRLSRFFDAKVYYSIEIEELNVSIHDDVAVAWGFHIEDFQDKGSAPERIMVRSSMTIRKDDTGQLITLLNHRDIQTFDENDRYIPTPAKP